MLNIKLGNKNFPLKKVNEILLMTEKKIKVSLEIYEESILRELTLNDFFTLIQSPQIKTIDIFDDNKLLFTYKKNSIFRIIRTVEPDNKQNYYIKLNFDILL